MWKGGQEEEQLKGPCLCLRFGYHLFSPDGWVLGCDADAEKCDVQIAKDNTTGISRRSFRVDIHPITCKPRLTNMSTRTLRITAGNRKVALAQQQQFLVSHAITLDLGAVKFRVWRPKLTVDAEEGYREKALEFSREHLASLPRYLPTLKTYPNTVEVNIRYGKNDTVYINLGDEEERGVTASVKKVLERSSDTIFAAKEPYYSTKDSAGIM